MKNKKADQKDREKNPIKKIPESELEIMQIVWHNPVPISRPAIEAELSKNRNLASTTILTLLSRLCEKQFLEVKKEGKSNLYQPLITEREYLATESRNLFDKLYGGSISTFATALCDSGVSEKELEELRRMLKEGML